MASLAPVYTRDSGPVVTAGTVLTAGAHTLSVTFTPTDTANYLTATASVPITVVKATPVISWATPANIVVGTALGPAQLNATVASPAGWTLVIRRVTGTCSAIGAAQLLSVTFTPTDTQLHDGEQDGSDHGDGGRHDAAGDGAGQDRQPDRRDV